YPQWTGRRDKNGCAIYIFPMRHLTIKRLDAYLKNISSCPTSREHMVDKPDITPRDLHFHALYENLQHFVFPFVSQLARPDMSIPISESTHIVDVSRVSIRQFWSIRKYLQEASATATAHYPETLGRVFIVGAPAFFKSIWDMISQWFDPVTRSKIFLLSSSDDESTLRSFIDPPNLPKAYGGELDWQWQDLPNLDGPAKELMDKLHQDTAEGQVFPKGSIIFERGCIRLLGTIDGMPRRDGYCPK
ncbi:hypothetical protein N7471_001765, partial [Penicillium samsonianum]|uniref:uncharacterized protein n=1 Tax=Penicillium samsonianum TaxID=1882272 RepID=UPI0025485591